MMNYLNLNLFTGFLTAGSFSLDFSTENAAIRTTLAASVPLVVNKQNWGSQAAADIWFMGEQFTLSCDFGNSGVADSGVTMYWKSGRVAEKGWDATQNDLIADRNDLVRSFQTYSGASGEDLSDTVKSFKFHWGHVLIGCSLQAMVVSLSIDWSST